MSGWFGSMGIGHPHTTDGDFFRSHGMSQEQYAADAAATQAKYDHFHEASAQSATDFLSKQAREAAAPRKAARRNDLIKQAGVGLVAGAVVGMVLLRVPAYSKMMTKQKSWQAAAVGAAVAVPLAAMYA